jgi:hypothetical protein
MLNSGWLALQHDLEAGVFHSGRPDLDLGLSFQTQLGGLDSKRYLGVIRLSYVW